MEFCFSFLEVGSLGGEGGVGVDWDGLGWIGSLFYGTLDGSLLAGRVGESRYPRLRRRVSAAWGTPLLMLVARYWKGVVGRDKTKGKGEKRG